MSGCADEVSRDNLTTNTAVIARLDRAIQYSEAVVIESKARGVLDAPVKPGHDTESGEL
ncbi:hypothetical protein [Bradyrhizobium sp. WSM1743]|uniref:hypothetical protein n=1 Tax=Bradyrhizobium sp. WSM1743 TaxID=318996 RepID=UPI0012EC3B0A|nr:hypothetical protein [Bradyrhizobium sp. WSM1743]